MRHSPSRSPSTDDLMPNAICPPASIREQEQGRRKTKPGRRKVISEIKHVPWRSELLMAVPYFGLREGKKKALQRSTSAALASRGPCLGAMEQLRSPCEGLNLYIVACGERGRIYVTKHNGKNEDDENVLKKDGICSREREKRRKDVEAALWRQCGQEQIGLTLFQLVMLVCPSLGRARRRHTSCYSFTFSFFIDVCVFAVDYIRCSFYNTCLQLDAQPPLRNCPTTMGEISLRASGHRQDFRI